MDDSRPSEVSHTAIEEEVVLAPSRSPSVSIPAPVDNNRVNEGSEDDGVHDVAAEGDALSDGPGDNSGGSSGESPLEEPGGLAGHFNVKGIRISSDEGREVSGVGGKAAGEAISEQPPADGPEGRIKDVFDENVLGVLDVHHADLKHSAEGNAGGGDQSKKPHDGS